MSLNGEDFSLEQNYLGFIVHRTIINQFIFDSVDARIPTYVITLMIKSLKRTDVGKHNDNGDFPLHLCCKAQRFTE